MPGSSRKQRKIEEEKAIIQDRMYELEKIPNKKAEYKKLWKRLDEIAIRHNQ